MTRLTRWVAIALVSATPTIALAQPLRYLGRAPGATGGAITLGERVHGDIYPGTDIPGWGRVKEVRDDRIVIERSRTGAEKEEMTRRGALSHDALEIHVLRDDLRDATGVPASNPR
jgi:hypothetical protein